MADHIVEVAQAPPECDDLTLAEEIPPPLPAQSSVLEIPFVDAAAPPLTLPEESRRQAPRDPPSTPSAARVSDTFLDTDVKQAIQSLANQIRASVIIDEQIVGFTSAVIDDEPFDAALRKILLPLNYHYKVVDGEYLIASADINGAMFPLISERYDYQTVHRSPDELLDLLPTRYLDYVRIGSKRNLMVIDAPEMLARRILDELHRSDQPVPQVVLEALVCVYSPDTEFRFGFDHEHGVRIDGADAARVALNGLALTGQYGPGGFSNLNDFTFTSSLLRALEKEGYVMIRAAPRVMSRDGERAEISIGRETFFSLQGDVVDQLLLRQDIQKVEAGITLDITPTIRGDRVTVNIERAEVSEDIRNQETITTGVDRFPVINRRRVSTTVHVNDGQTIVIGGLMQRQEVDQLNKVMFLGDLPVVGRLFRRVDRETVDVEVAIFISPSIVRDCTCDPVQPGLFHSPEAYHSQGHYPCPMEMEAPCAVAP